MAGEDLKILVTGASGFIGHHVVAEVARRGMRPVPLIRSGSSIFGLEAYAEDVRRADLRDEDALGRAVLGMDVVIHLAGLTRARSLDAFREVNARGVSRLVRACRRKAPELERLLLVSSLAASGPAGADRPRRESDLPRPVSPYGRSKLEGEEALRAEAGPLPWTVVRPPIVFGPFERDVLAIFRMCRRGCVPVPGFRDKHYSVVYGPDLARAIVDLALDPRAAGETWFVAEERSYSYRELVRAIGEAVGRIPWMPRIPHLVPRLLAALGSGIQPLRRRPPLLTLAKLPEVLAQGWVCSSEKARARDGGLVTTPLPEAARATADWYRTQGWL